MVNIKVLRNNEVLNLNAVLKERNEFKTLNLLNQFINNMNPFNRFTEKAQEALQQAQEIAYEKIKVKFQVCIFY